MKRTTQKADEERDKRRRLNRDGRINQHRATRLAGFEAATCAEERVENREDTTTGVGVPGRPIEGETPIEDPDLRSRTLIEEEEIRRGPPDLTSQILIEEDDIQQGLFDLIIREDENYDPDIFITDPRLYDIEPKEEIEGGLDPETGAKRRAEVRAQTANTELQQAMSSIRTVRIYPTNSGPETI